jgi:hypothetical protein
MGVVAVAGYQGRPAGRGSVDSVDSEGVRRILD